MESETETTPEGPSPDQTASPAEPINHLPAVDEPPPANANPPHDQPGAILADDGADNTAREPDGLPPEAPAGSSPSPSPDAIPDSPQARQTRPRLPAVRLPAGVGRWASALPRGLSFGRGARLARRHPRVALAASAATMLLVVAAVLSGLGVSDPAAFGLVSLSATRATPTHAPTARATPAPTITPRPTPNPNIARNAAMGCAEGAPPASSSVLFGARDHQTGGPAPAEVALTFDDGPTPYTTPPILDYLEQTHTPATFFVLGLYAHVWPDLIRREWESGFAIGAHSWDHPQVTILPDNQMPHQYGDTLSAIHAAIGQDACIWFWRPPYGAYNPRVVSISQSYGLTTVMWDADPADWSRPGADTIARRVLAQVHPGSIVVMHDGPARREQTLAALPLILDGLRARGLTPVTLPKLLSDSHYPGVQVKPQFRRDPPDLAAPWATADTTAPPLPPADTSGPVPLLPADGTGE